MKPPSKLFCIGDLIPSDLIWYPLSKSLGVSDFLLSKSYQGMLSKVALVSVYWAVYRWNRIANRMFHLDFWNIYYRIFPIIWHAVPTKLLSFLQAFCTSILPWNCLKRNDGFGFFTPRLAALCPLHATVLGQLPPRQSDAPYWPYRTHSRI